MGTPIPTKSARSYGWAFGAAYERVCTAVSASRAWAASTDPEVHVNKSIGRITFNSKHDFRVLVFIDSAKQVHYDSASMHFFGIPESDVSVWVADITARLASSS